jgi:hypothetical protein
LLFSCQLLCSVLLDGYDAVHLVLSLDGAEDNGAVLNQPISLADPPKTAGLAFQGG